MPRPSSSQTSTPVRRCPDEPPLAPELCRTPHPCLLEPKHLVPFLAKLLCQLMLASGHTHTSLFSWVQRRDIAVPNFSLTTIPSLSARSFFVCTGWAPIFLSRTRLQYKIEYRSSSYTSGFLAALSCTHLEKPIHQGRAPSHSLTAHFRQHVRALVARLSCMAANVEGLNTRQPSCRARLAMAVLALTLHLCVVTSKAWVESAIQLTRRNLAPEFPSSRKSDCCRCGKLSRWCRWRGGRKLTLQHAWSTRCSQETSVSAIV